jgi:hypothetical protein
VYLNFVKGKTIKDLESVVQQINWYLCASGVPRHSEALKHLLLSHEHDPLVLSKAVRETVLAGAEIVYSNLAWYHYVCFAARGTGIIILAYHYRGNVGEDDDSDRDEVDDSSGGDDEVDDDGAGLDNGSGGGRGRGMTTAVAPAPTTAAEEAWGMTTAVAPGPVGGAAFGGDAS